MQLFRCRRVRPVVALILLFASISAAADKPKQVLVLDSYERNFASVDVFNSVFRSELLNQFSKPLSFSDVSVEPARFASDSADRSFLDYLLSTF